MNENEHSTAVLVTVSISIVIVLIVIMWAFVKCCLCCQYRLKRCCRKKKKFHRSIPSSFEKRLHALESQMGLDHKKD